jgi:hypothetical protein
MKNRVRIDMSFEEEADALSLMTAVKALTGKAVSVNEGSDNEEISYIEHELCGHDEGKACTRLEKIEIRKQ